MELTTIPRISRIYCRKRRAGFLLLVQKTIDIELKDARADQFRIDPGRFGRQ